MEQSKKILTAFAGIALVFLGGMVYATLKHSSSAPMYQNNVQEMPVFDLPNLDGFHVRDTDMNGPYFVHVFATWCHVCQDEMPVLQKWSAQQGVPILGVGFQDDAQSLRSFSQDYPNVFKYVLVDEIGSLSTDLGITGTPETFLVDANGQIIQHWVGSVKNEKILGHMTQAWQDII